MKHFLKIAEGIDVAHIVAAIHRQPELWNRHRLRKDRPDSPHVAMDDIWIRANDLNKCKDGGFNDPHFSIWYDAAFALPVRQLIFWVMTRVEAEQLGGVLITRLPPGGRIDPHADLEWHALWYQKYYLSLKSAPGVTFHVENESINPKVGEIWLIDNTKPHWVVNDSDDDRVTLIICAKTERYEERYAG
jgi:hypothetical protein